MIKPLIGCAAVLSLLAAPAAAGARYDRKLEQAVMTIVAGKIGHIRGGFAYDDRPQLVVVQEAMFTGSIWIETARLAKPVAVAAGITGADERKVSRIIAY